MKGSDRSSFSIVDQKYFSKITKRICPPKVTVLSRKLLFSHPPKKDSNPVPYSSLRNVKSLPENINVVIYLNVNNVFVTFSAFDV